MSGASVSIQGVSRRFDLGAEQIWALRDVSLDIAPGEFVALIGRSGSGKTTLLNLIAGLDKPTAGDLLVDGRSVPSMSEHELIELRRRTIGFVFQSFGLLPLLSAYENVELPLRIAGMRHGERSKRVRQVLEMVGLGRRAGHRPYELSGGEQQRVAIARALAIRPSLILADEPTGELDSATATAIFTLMRDFARSEGVTIITSTHDRLVMELAGRVEELSNGRHVGQGHLLRTVAERERSPFAAPLPMERDEEVIADAWRPGSLIGADTAHFVRPGSIDHDPSAPPAASLGPGRGGAAEPGQPVRAEARPEPEPAHGTPGQAHGTPPPAGPPQAGEPGGQSAPESTWAPPRSPDDEPRAAVPPPESHAAELPAAPTSAPQPEPAEPDDDVMRWAPPGRR